MRLSPENVRDLVPVGAAAALSAAFNTPVAAVLFALEEIIGDMNAALLGSTVVASVAAVIVERSILGNEPLFHVPTYQLVHPAELLAYAGLGIVGGVLSVAFCKALLAARLLFLRLPARSKVFQPAMGGLVIGVVIVFVPAVMGVGYEIVGQALNGGLLLKTMILLCLVKLCATIISYASGNAGGIFAPSLFIGAMAGGAVGMVVHSLAPFPTAEPGAYALVGMGTLFAGIIRAPMTSVFMIFEITQDHQILVPLMVANMLSYAISKRYQKAPVYHALLQQDDIHLPSLAAPDPALARTARHLMRTEVPFVAADLPVERAFRMVADQDAPAHLVGTRQRLVGCVTRQQLERWMAAGKSAEAVGTMIEGSAVHVYPDHPIDVVLDRFAQTGGLLPVMSRTTPGQVEGVVTLDSILRVIDRRARRRETAVSVPEGAASDATKTAGSPPPAE
jgi:CIC family chloride channel protein